MTFAESLQNLRRELAFSQRALATEAGVAITTIAHIENGSRRPDSATAARLAAVAARAGRTDLAEVMVVDIPGVREGLLVPSWRLPKPPQPTDEGLDQMRVSDRGSAAADTAARTVLVSYTPAVPETRTVTVRLFEPEETKKPK